MSQTREKRSKTNQAIQGAGRTTSGVPTQYESARPQGLTSNTGRGDGSGTGRVQEDAGGMQYVCRIDSAFAVKDYLRRGMCVRFSGIAPGDIVDGVLSRETTVTCVDVDLWEFVRLYKPRFSNWSIEGLGPSLLALENVGFGTEGSGWFRINLTPAPDGLSYAYPLFNPEVALTRYKLDNVQSQHTSEMTPRDAPEIPGDADIEQLAGELSRGRQPYRFHAFHVGQGMCSLIENGTWGFLIDAGAGTPVTRQKYLAGSIRTNQLKAITRGLKKVIFILSHADADHWRLLSWDAELLGKIHLALVPSSLPVVPFFDKAIRDRVRYIGDLDIALGNRQLLRVIRSRPQTLDRNGDGLVCVFETGRGGSILAPGDYVYERYATDRNAEIRKLATSSFSSMQVPHHGDERSKRVIPPPSHGQAMAFFSAGNHKGYGHPTLNSIDAHAKTYINVNHFNGLSARIVAHRLR